MGGARIASTEESSNETIQHNLCWWVSLTGKGVIHYKFIPRGQAVDKEFYVAGLKRKGSSKLNFN
jgi:hypothetical protein